ncbi:SDR family oxidoreductase [Chlorobium ferrooxidans]|uniref:NAD-dependent epimerase/dehydratase n=1 Tax=Chlorobium ferrooxidans DSM 13031 TaxID=377431 RepID=Q0YQH7_9CHLB|nr:SDR family oxidoreductase [Chlorobium ferrooxidans]EAT58533.1 NAD-dependent epimerase/dehydratase [Chlorobium ferrooxidans DSM 13031]
MSAFKGSVLVAGATGRTGEWVVKRLQAHGIAFRLFVRSGEKAIRLFGPEIIDRLTIGSVEHPAEIRAAVRNASAVISAIGGNVTDPAAPPPSAIDRDGIINLATIAKEEDVRHFILVSSLSVTKPDHPLNKYGQVLSMKLEAENEVRRLYSEPGFTYTILRPGGLLDGAPLQHNLLFDTGDNITTGVIQRSDVAEVAVLSLFTPEAHNLTFELIEKEEVSLASLAPFFKQIHS